MDIVQRLRNHAMSDPSHAHLLREAADLIEAYQNERKVWYIIASYKTEMPVKGLEV